MSLWFRRDGTGKNQDTDGSSEEEEKGGHGVSGLLSRRGSRSVSVSSSRRLSRSGTFSGVDNPGDGDRDGGGDRDESSESESDESVSDNAFGSKGDQYKNKFNDKLKYSDGIGLNQHSYPFIVENNQMTLRFPPRSETATIAHLVYQRNINRGRKYLKNQRKYIQPIVNHKNSHFLYSEEIESVNSISTHSTISQSGPEPISVNHKKDYFLKKQNTGWRPSSGRTKLYFQQCFMHGMTVLMSAIRLPPLPPDGMDIKTKSYQQFIMRVNLEKAITTFSSSDAFNQSMNRPGTGAGAGKGVEYR